ncbi:hypothetical protein BYT27DRAFT_7342797 [Phlegmacium glaucopus]|nr:hypothetical protein BYT27DRAFT_7342797 [Phlegmacium glaucopus]
MVFEYVKTNEGDTTTESRTFIKIMTQDAMEGMSLKTLAERIKDPEGKRGCEAMFPMDHWDEERFTEEMREYLKMGFLAIRVLSNLEILIVVGSILYQPRCTQVDYGTNELCSRQTLGRRIILPLTLPRTDPSDSDSDSSPADPVDPSPEGDGDRWHPRRPSQDL